MRRNAALISYSHISWSNTGNCVIKMCSQKFHLRMLFITCLNTFEHVWTHAHVIVCLSWKGLVMLVENVTNGSTWCRTFRPSIDILIVCKRVPAPPPPPCFLRHSPLDPACPPSKICVYLPLCSVPPLLRYFRQSPRTIMQIPPAPIRPTNLSCFKEMSKQQIYQFNCRFLSKISFNLLNPFTNRLS